MEVLSGVLIDKSLDYIFQSLEVNISFVEGFQIYFLIGNFFILWFMVYMKHYSYRIQFINFSFVTVAFNTLVAILLSVNN